MIDSPGRLASFQTGRKGTGTPCPSCVGKSPLDDHGQGAAKIIPFKPNSSLNATQIPGYRAKGDGQDKSAEERNTPAGYTANPNDGSSVDTTAALTPAYKTNVLKAA